MPGSLQGKDGRKLMLVRFREECGDHCDDKRAAQRAGNKELYGPRLEGLQ